MIFFLFKIVCYWVEGLWKEADLNSHILTERTTLVLSYQFVQNRRPVIQPNVGFMQQLRCYDETGCDEEGAMTLFDQYLDEALTNLERNRNWE